MNRTKQKSRSVAPAQAATLTQPSVLPRINLLPTSPTPTRRRRRQLAGLTASVLTAAALILVGSVAAGHQLDSAQRHRDLAVQRQRQVQEQVDQYADVQATYQAVDNARATLQAALGSEIRYSRMLNTLSTTIPATVQITSAHWQQATDNAALTPRPGTATTSPSTVPGPGTSTEAGQTGTLTISGLTSSYHDVAAWLDAVDHMAGLANATLLTSSRTTRDPNVVRFTTAAVLTPEALSGRYSGPDGGLQ